jgi:DNA-binding transcriptional regulator YiaG
MIKLTTDHPSSSYGIPVFVDDAGETMGYGTGMKKARKQLKMKKPAFAAMMGVATSTIDNWDQSRNGGPPNTTALILLQKFLEEKLRVTK